MVGMRFFFSFLLFFSFITLKAQLTERPEEVFTDEWRKGSVTLVNGDLIEGEIEPLRLALNFLSIRADGATFNFDPSKVERFSYSHDEGKDVNDLKERNYYSIDNISIIGYKPHDNPSFYEVIYESADYAVLGYHITEVSKEAHTDINNPGYRYEYTTVHFDEVIFILSKNGQTFPFLIITENVAGGWEIFNRKFINKKIINEFFPIHKQAIKDFIKENRLSLKRKDHLQQIFQFADTLDD